MNLIRMTTPQCTLYSAAMILDMDPKELEKALGIDTMKVEFRELLGSGREFRSVTFQELTDYFYFQHNLALIQVSAYPAHAPEGADPKQIWPLRDARVRLINWLMRKRAFLCMPTHTCAWDGARVYDPARGIYDLESLPDGLECVYIVVRSDHSCMR